MYQEFLSFTIRLTVRTKHEQCCTRSRSNIIQFASTNNTSFSISSPAPLPLHSFLICSLIQNGCRWPFDWPGGALSPSQTQPQAGIHASVRFYFLFSKSHPYLPDFATRTEWISVHFRTLNTILRRYYGSLRDDLIHHLPYPYRTSRRKTWWPIWWEWPRSLLSSFSVSLGITPVSTIESSKWGWYKRGVL